MANARSGCGEHARVYGLNEWHRDDDVEVLKRIVHARMLCHVVPEDQGVHMGT